MNFLCHALPYFDNPVVAACTGVPDWLSVIDRKIRARGRSAEAHLSAADAVTRDVAAGIVAHVRDDRWFHGGETFTRMNLEFAVALRDRLPGDAGFRPSFVGHILIEMLLDANYVVDRRDLVDEYYEMLRRLPASNIEMAVNVITGKPSDQIAAAIGHFVELGFLYDYAEDAPLLRRVNQVLGRVGLPRLPDGPGDDSVLAWIGDARALVRRNHTRLLTDPGYAPEYPPLG